MGRISLLDCPTSQLQQETTAAFSDQHRCSSNTQHLIPVGLCASAFAQLETLQQPDPKLCLLVGLNVEVSNVQHLERKPRQCTVMFHQHVADAGPAFHADISREPRLPQSLPCHVLIRMIMKMSECK